MGITLKFFGHASFQINAGDKIIYTDPYEGGYTEPADLILVTHSHDDHCDVAKIKKIRKDDTVVIAPEDCVSKIGGDVKVLKPREKTSVENVLVEAT
ncbi:MAG: MBL fold metallo-hydrolase, partial [Thermoproteota archaeon]|nr:MBL fold metallo-hydrolase [Thermoproteota archaeon]